MRAALNFWMQRCTPLPVRQSGWPRLPSSSVSRISEYMLRLSGGNLCSTLNAMTCAQKRGKRFKCVHGWLYNAPGESFKLHLSQTMRGPLGAPRSLAGGTVMQLLCHSIVHTESHMYLCDTCERHMHMCFQQGSDISHLAALGQSLGAP